jgi:hypothetical protein
VEQKICLDTNANRALELARAELARYMVLPNYRNNWLRQGFTEQDLQDGGSERFLNAMVVWGNEATIVYTMNANILRVMDHQGAAEAHHLTPRECPRRPGGLGRDDGGSRPDLDRRASPSG